MSRTPEERDTPRRYGLFGVSAYPKKSAMQEEPRKSMTRLISIVMLLLAAALVALLVFSSASPGLTVTFDAMGGSDVASQAVQYGDLAADPGNSLRPGYTLVGWSTAPEGEALWDFETDTVTGSLTLYAVWAAE